MTKQTTKSSRSTLNPKQELFVLEYLKDFNAKQAAIRSGYEPASAKCRGSSLLDREDVQKRIAETFTKVTSKVQVDVEFVLRELLQIANCDIKEAFDQDGCLLPLAAIPVPVRKAIASINVDELWEWEKDGKKRTKVKVGETKKITFWDKKGSLELLGKYLAMFIERQRHEGHDGEALPSVQVHIHKHSPSVKVDEAATRPAVAEAAQ